MSRSEAFTGLALQFWRHVLGTPWRKPRGLQQVMSDFAADGVRDVTAAERAAAPRMSRCNGCGRCDFLVAEGEPPSLVLLRVARQSNDASAAWARLSPLQPFASAITAVCPESVDVQALLARVKRLAESETSK